MQKTDLFVIGAGSAGVRAARIAATHGAKVMIAEDFRIGGTCVIRGCVPKKLLVYASHYQDEFEDAKGFGFTVENIKFDWSKLKTAVQSEVTRLEGIYERNMKAAGVEVLRATASIKDKHHVQLSNGDVIKADKILIATGGTPFVDATIEGYQHAMTSNEVFLMETFPKSVLILGAGYIAVEFAGIFNGLGAKTHLAYRGDKVLRGFDADIQDYLTNEMTNQNIQLHKQVTVKSITKQGDDFITTFTNGETLTTAAVLAATGRIPNIAHLSLENAGIKTDKVGAILVDSKGKTNVDSIYAAGDVTNRVNLTPVAIREGHAIADSLYGGKNWQADHTLIPTAVFSNPEIGTIGLSEQEARLQFNIDVYKTSFRGMKHTLSGRQTKTFMKLLVNRDDDKVVGCHLLGEASGEMIQLIGIALKMGATKRQFDATMAVHPTASEELVTMRSASSSYKRGE